ncbi:MAG: hypothetical protein JXR69_02945 [Candidatus Delongbacteria bacterium]|nr:hypothetical protein [Candidatus Delongbacteria bacterium]
MKKLMMLILALSMTIAFAVPNATKIEFSAKTGDKELDVSLSEFNVEAKLNIKNFNREMITNYDVTEKKLEMLKVDYRMQPADVYMALEVSKASGKPMRDVLLQYKENGWNGWGFIAKKMGVKPGSKEFKGMKNRIKERKHRKEKKQEKKEIENKSEVKPQKSEIKKSNQGKGKAKK